MHQDAKMKACKRYTVHYRDQVNTLNHKGRIACPVQGLQMAVAKRHPTHYSPLNFDLTLASLNCIANHQKWVQSSEFVGHW